MKHQARNRCSIALAIVTGSGRGIGRRVAILLPPRAGAHVVIVDQAPERIASVTAAVEDLGVQAMGVATDVSRSDEVKRMVQQTVERFGKIDILCEKRHGSREADGRTDRRGMGPRARR